VVTTPVVCLLGVEGAGASCTRRSHALSKGRDVEKHTSREKTRGEIAKPWLKTMLFENWILEFSPNAPKMHSSCPDLIRASILFTNTLLKVDGYAGQGPRMTTVGVACIPFHINKSIGAGGRWRAPSDVPTCRLDFE
jgi:hypothetical protein